LSKIDYIKATTLIIIINWDDNSENLLRNVTLNFSPAENITGVYGLSFSGEGTGKLPQTAKNKRSLKGVR
jgi:hypothetical protein